MTVRSMLCAALLVGEALLGRCAGKGLLLGLLMVHETLPYACAAAFCL